MVVRGIESRNSFNVLFCISRNLIEILIVIDHIMVCSTIISLFCEISGVSNPEDKVTSIVNKELKINLLLSSVKRCVEQPIVLHFELMEWLLPVKTSLELQVLLDVVQDVNAFYSLHSKHSHLDDGECEILPEELLF